VGVVLGNFLVGCQALIPSGFVSNDCNNQLLWGRSWNLWRQGAAAWAASVDQGRAARRLLKVVGAQLPMSKHNHFVWLLGSKEREEEEKDKNIPSFAWSNKSSLKFKGTLLGNQWEYRFLSDTNNIQQYLNLLDATQHVPTPTGWHSSLTAALGYPYPLAMGRRHQHQHQEEKATLTCPFTTTRQAFHRRSHCSNLVSTSHLQDIQELHAATLGPGSHLPPSGASSGKNATTSQKPVASGWNLPSPRKRSQLVRLSCLPLGMTSFSPRIEESSLPRHNSLHELLAKPNQQDATKGHNQGGHQHSARMVVVASKQ